MLHTQSYTVLGIPISATNPQSAMSHVLGWVNDDVGRFICVREVSSLMVCKNDPYLLALHSDASLVFPDGMPLVWIGKKRGFDVQRTCGPDFMELMMASSVERNLKHYLFGGKPGVVEKLADKIRGRYPGVDIVGKETPPFRTMTELEKEATRQRILNSGADIVWVGISSPKQDVWMHENFRQLSQTLIGVGAAFDFLSGEVNRAPVWMQRLGLEWLSRLYSEPRRLWRRYLILAPKFVWQVFREK